MNLNNAMQGRQVQQAQPQRQPIRQGQGQQSQPVRQGQNQQIQPIQPQQDQQQEGQGQVSPEAQQEFDIFVANGMSVVHSKKVTKSILNNVSKNKNRLEAFATILVTVVSKLFDSASSNKVSLTNGTLLHGSNVLLQEILGVAYAAGMGELTEEQKTEIFQRGLGMYLNQAVKSGRMTNEELIALGEQQKQTQAGQEVMKTAADQGAMQMAASPGATQPAAGQGLMQTAQKSGGV